MSDLAVSLISGLLGVFVGSIIQLSYDYCAVKRQKREDCKKECINEWLQFKNEIRGFLENSNELNHLFFRQSFLIKTELLNSIFNSRKSKTKVSELVLKLRKKDEIMSLSGIAERALRKNATSREKKQFEIEMFSVICDTIKEIQNI